jgi:hypothetical protein
MIVIAIIINIARNETEQTIVEEANESNEDKKRGDTAEERIQNAKVGGWNWKSWR